MVLRREKSVVRFQRGSSPEKRSNSLFQTRQKSDLRNRHLYAPRLHRQQTEHPPVSILGASLKKLAECGCRDDEFYSVDRSSARHEFKDIIDKSFISISRNSFGIQFLEPIHLKGFAHWQSQPEKKVITFIPLHIPKLQVEPRDPGTVIFNLPRRFPSQVSLNPLELKNPNFSGRYLSSQKLFSIILKNMIRVLGFKSVTPDRIRSSETNGTMEIDLLENEGWIGEIVFCLVLDKSETSMCYCRKPFYNVLEDLPDDEILEGDSSTEDVGPMIDDAPLSVASMRSQSKLSVFTKASDENVSIDIGDGSLSLSRASANTDKDRRSANDATSLTLTRAKSTRPEDHEYDVTWFACHPKSENNLVEAISATDGRVRLTAMLIVFRLLQCDWRLLPIASYHLQAAMLHESDHVLDSSPRWQRSSLESCVKMLLLRLHDFACLGYLPHFCVSNMDLWLFLSRKQVALAKNALERLAHSDTALLSLARRAGRLDANVIEQESVSDLKVDLLRINTSSRHGLLKPVEH